ncbi:sodium/hydrogen exchanger 1-like isoform X2 [Aristolochia californica]|uniref:sodium/hydrogen exchanger 1-like isoform X2 n=1 Tax=Aristolochia californica TaxID=171875 RepID=UPI0035DFE1A5
MSIVISLTSFFTLLCLCIILGHLLEENRWANESITALLLGLCVGAVVLVVSHGTSSRLLSFSEELFFIYLLPPIIFNAGFQVKKKQFFRNFTTILLFGAIGTLISFGIISAGAYFLFKLIGVTSLEFKDYLAIGAILSATDSVCTLQVLNQDETPLLYSLVFGEGVVNDATSIVLFNAVQTLDFNKIDAIIPLKLLGTFLFLFFTSTSLGIVVGLLSAFIIKKLYIGRHSTDREVALMMLMAYLSYMLAQLFYLSGILTVFFCGIVMSHYTWHNVTESSRITTRHVFGTISFIAEIFIFLYVGMDALDLSKWKASKARPETSVAVSVALIALVLIGRAAFVFPLSAISNCFGNRIGTIIDLRQQFIMWWAGLMRGAVTIALSYNKFTVSGSTASEDHALIITCTILVVLLSTVFGSVTKPLIEATHSQHLRPGAESEPAIFEDIHLWFLDNERQAPCRSSLSLLIRHPTSTVHYFWRKFDDKYMRPVFGGRGFVPFVPGSQTVAADESIHN